MTVASILSKVSINLSLSACGDSVQARGRWVATGCRSTKGRGSAINSKAITESYQTVQGLLNRLMLKSPTNVKMFVGVLTFGVSAAPNVRRESTGELVVWERFYSWSLSHGAS